MKPQSPPDLPTDDLFRNRLENLIDTGHKLVKLSELIDWEHSKDPRRQLSGRHN